MGIRDHALDRWYFSKRRAGLVASLALALVVGIGSPIVVQASAAPEITSADTFGVSEGTTGVATLAATDTDTATADLTWSKTGGADADKFNLSSAGVLTFPSAKDFENPDMTIPTARIRSP